MRIQPRFRPLRVELDIELEYLERILLGHSPPWRTTGTHAVADAASQIGVALAPRNLHIQSELGVRIDLCRAQRESRDESFRLLEGIERK